jgi:hypothetical protein
LRVEIPVFWNGGDGRTRRSFESVTAGASTPEELETLLEDAFVLRDTAALAALFEERALLGTLDGCGEARGAAAIAEFVCSLWNGGHTYVAAPRQVLQAGTEALLLAERNIALARRGSDGAWRYAISLFS